MKIRDEKILEIKSNLDIVDFVSEHISVKKAGSSYIALCPFHNEKTPSMNLNRAKQFFHCFGCGASGDIFTFLQQVEKISFSEALVKLAERANVRLENLSDAEAVEAKIKSDKLKKMYKVNELTADFYHDNIKKPSQEVKEFIKARGLSPESINDFKIGYAPDAWRSLIDFLIKSKVPINLACELGLVKQKNDTPKNTTNPADFYDLFRNRIVFPIFDSSKRILGFSCRKLESGPNEDKTNPKYINSPETEIYHKRNSLYGIHIAAKYASVEDLVIVVEGNIDCVSLHGAGFKNTVATLGTALTNTHVERIKRLSNNIVIIFDSDNAGVMATQKAFSLFAEQGLYGIKTVSLPKGFDPDSYVKANGPLKFRELVTKAEPLIEKLITGEVDKIANPTPTDKAQIYKKCEEIIEKAGDPVVKQFYYKFLNNTLGTKIYRKDLSPVSQAQGKAYKKVKHDKAEETLVRIVLHYPLIGSKLFSSVLNHEIIELIKEQSLKNVMHEFINTFSTLEFNTGTNFSVTEENYPEKITSLMMTRLTAVNDENAIVLSELLSDGLELKNEKIEMVLNDCLNKLKERSIQVRLNELLVEIKKAEETKDTVLKTKVLKQYQELLRN